VAVYGGHTDKKKGDIVICTTHQLFRYKGYRFDLLIIDEVDAFPFWNNEKLMNDAEVSARTKVYMSATPPQVLIDKTKDNQLDYHFLKKRYHNKPIPLPSVYPLIKGLTILHMIYLIRRWKTKGIKTIIYVPLIEVGERLRTILSMFIRDIKFISSKTENRTENIEAFKKGKSTLIATIILERGVTIKNLNVIIYDASHLLFKNENLIQIIGRVGRDQVYSTGKIVFYGKKNSEVKKTIQEIRYANS